MRLHEIAWTEIVKPAAYTLVLPLGATEQHGPHLPLGTDSLIAEALATELARRRTDVIVAPTLPFGSSGEHQAFPGTLSIAQEGIELVLLELARSARDFRGILVFSWHGGNSEAVDRAIARLRLEGNRVTLWRPPPSRDAHAGWTETALVLALAPELVDIERAEPGATESIEAVMPRLRAGGVAAVSPNGVLGDPTEATAEAGRTLFESLVSDLVATHDAGLSAWHEAT